MYVSSIHRSNFFTTVLCYWGSCKIRSRHPWVPGDHVRSKQEKFLKVLNGYELTIQATPHMALFASFEKSQFAEVSETLRRDRVRSKWNFLKKFLTGLSRRFRRHPTWHLLLHLKKVGFRRSLGTLRRGPWGPGEVKIDFFQNS